MLLGLCLSGAMNHLLTGHILELGAVRVPHLDSTGARLSSTPLFPLPQANNNSKQLKVSFALGDVSRGSIFVSK